MDKHSINRESSLSASSESDPKQEQQVDVEQEPELIYKPPQWTIYLAFVVFCNVVLLENLYYAFAQVEAPEQARQTVPKWTTFNPALPYFLDTLMRTLIALFFVKNPIDSLQLLKNMGWAQFLKIFVARFMLQTGYVLETVAMIFLSGSIRMVITQTRIGLVGLLRYFCLGESLSRNQFIFVVAIVSSALAWNVDGGMTDTSGNVLGWFSMSSSLLLMSSTHVLTERILQNDFQNIGFWTKQLCFSLIDIPIGALLPFFLSWFDRDVANLPREWNPFANADWFVFALTINNSIWGLVSYFILNYCDALWLNLTFVLAMGLTWPAELLIKHLQLADNLDTTFSATKVFILIGLLAVCIGYEFENQEVEEKKEK